MSLLRKDFLVDIEKEVFLLGILAKTLIASGINSSNTIIVTVSTDYSSFVGQYLRHALSFNGEICDGFGIDVPYPDESWDDDYDSAMVLAFETNNYLFSEGKKLLFVEAGVIRGGNYKYVTDFLKLHYSNTFSTLTMFENIGSSYKSDFVGEYYDDKIQDLTFWWEVFNNHWRS